MSDRPAWEDDGEPDSERNVGDRVAATLRTCTECLAEPGVERTRAVYQSCWVLTH
eukprot:gene1328-3341_t